MTDDEIEKLINKEVREAFGDLLKIIRAKMAELDAQTVRSHDMILSATKANGDAIKILAARYGIKLDDEEPKPKPN